MSKETISQTEGLCKEVATCIRNAYDRGYKQGFKDGNYDKEFFCNLNFEHGTNKGLDDAWKCVRKLILSESYGGLELYEIEKIFGDGNYPRIIRTFSASECMAKIKEYEENKKADDEIKVGDEVEHNFNLYKVFGITESGKCCCIGDVTRFFDKEDLKKTGKHFDEIEELMKKIGVDDE